MSNISVGVDLVDISRISKKFKNKKFIERIYTPVEIKYCESKNNASQHFAGRLAGKEAVGKALKISWPSGINWKDIEVISDHDIPQVVLYGEAKKTAEEKKITNIQISISHEKDYAVAFVIAVGNGKYGK